MTIKEYIKQLAQSFFIVVTLINAAMIILGRLYSPAQPLSYDVFKYPIIYGFCSMIPALIMYSSKELTVRELIVRKMIQMVLIMVLIVLFIFGPRGICPQNAGKITGVSASILIVYVLEEVISWLVNTREAERFTESLHKYQEIYRKETPHDK